MKKVKYIICAGVLLLGLAASLQAATSKDKLINSIYKDQRESEKQIVKMWINKQRGKELQEELAEYVAREIRLKAMTGNTKTQTLISKATENAQAEFKTPEELARAIVVEHLKEKGIDIRNCTYVKGEYLIQKSSLE